MTAGRLVLLTGGSQGLGYAAATRFAERGLRVLLTSRSADRAREAADRIAHATGGDVTGAALDLSDLVNVRGFAAALRRREPYLSVLVANAAVRPPRRRTLSPQGHELVFATDHLGHAVLALDLLEPLRAAADRDGDARVVVVSSRLHRPTSPGPRVALDPDAPDLDRGYRPMRAYKNAKLANLLFTFEFERRHGGDGLHADALCPGFVPATIADGATGLRRLAYRHVFSRLPFARTIAQAVDTYEYVALAPQLRGRGGSFYAERRRIDSSHDSRDGRLATRLWELTLTRRDRVT